MKEQALQEEVKSTYVLETRGKIFKWWAGGYSNGGVL
jgi:hypothetical protein